MNFKKLAALSFCCAAPLIANAAPAAKADNAPAAKADNAPAAKADAAPAVKVEDKLLPLVTMEQAFAKALQLRATYANYIATESAKLKDAKDADKPAIEANIKKVSTDLNTLKFYMDAIFGIENRREYEYNPVTSTIYLKVGSVAEVFTRAVAKKDLIKKKLVEINKAYEEEKDVAKKAELEKQKEAYTKAYAIMANALFAVYQIHPNRNYQYDADKALLYLKTNDEEIKKLNDTIKAQKEAAAKKASEKK